MSFSGRQLLPVIVALAIVRPVAPAQTRPAGPRSVVGAWSGPHADLLVEEQRAQVDYECGTGTIDGAVRPDAQGSFHAHGTHLFARGEPRMLVEAGFTAHRAEYRGWSDGSVMRFTVALTDTGRTLGPFELRRGAAAAPAERCEIGWWGGDHIGIVVREDGARVEYDCAAGTIEGPLRPDSSGNFDMHGAHVFERGGPREAGEPAGRTRPARYRGWTDGKRMRLTVTLVDTGQELGRFQLELGRRPNLERCL